MPVKPGPLGLSISSGSTVLFDLGVAVHRQSRDRRAVGGDSRADTSPSGPWRHGAVAPRRHGRFGIGAVGSRDELPFCAQHKTNTTRGSVEDQHANNTDKTVLPGI
jgi:hypothetical protein